MDKVVEAAAAFAEKLSSDGAVARASKSLEVDIIRRERVINGKIWTQTSSNSSQLMSLRLVKSSARRFTMHKIPIQPPVIAKAKERFLSQATLAGVGDVGRNINSSNSAGREKRIHLRGIELKSRHSERTG